MQNRNNLNIELIRCLAIFFVILIHMSMTPFHNRDLFLSGSWLIQNFYFAVSRFCVPAFFLISAYFFFTKPSTSLNSIKSRISKILIPLVFWSIAYYTYYVCKYTNYDFSAEKFLHGFLYTNSAFHLWFLYKFLGFCLFLPIAYACYSALPKRTYAALAIIFIIPSSILPFITAIFPNISQYEPLRIVDNFAIARLPDGDFIYAFLAPILISALNTENLRKLHLISIIGAALLANFSLTYYLSEREGATNEFFYSYYTPLVAVYSVCLFLLISKIDLNSSPNFVKKAISEIGSSTLGIYLVHWMVYMTIEEYIPNNNEMSYFTCISNSATIFTISLIIASTMRRLPFIRRVI